MTLYRVDERPRATTLINTSLELNGLVENIGSLPKNP